jgi:predicted secreted protein
MAEKILETVKVEIHDDLYFNSTTVTVKGHYRQDGFKGRDTLVLTGDDVASAMPSLIAKLKEKMADGGHTVSDIPVYVAPDPEPAPEE